MPQRRTDPKIIELLSKKYGEQLPRGLFDTNRDELLAAQRAYTQRQQQSGFASDLQQAASKFGQIEGVGPETSLDKDWRSRATQPAADKLRMAEQDYSDRDKVRKYVADKYLTRPEEKVRNPWMSTGKQDEQGYLILYNKETGESKKGPKLDLSSSKKTPSGEVLKRADNVAMGLSAMQSAKEALDNLPSNRLGAAASETFTLGSTDYENALDQWAEAFGRMQSGGAINEAEEQRFKRMAPGVWDSPEIREKKYQRMVNEFQRRAQSLESISPGITRGAATQQPQRFPSPDLSGANRILNGLSDQEQKELEDLEREFGGPNVRPR